MATAIQSPPPKVKPQPQFAGILRDHEPYALGNRDDLGNRLNGWFDCLVLQSGLRLAPAMLLSLCSCAAIFCGGLAFVLAEDLLAVGLGAAVGFGLPLLVTMFRRSRRQKKMTEQLPPMIDELSRAARTGRSLENCLRLVAGDTPAPLGDELKRATKKMEMGLTVSESMRGLPERTGLVATSILTTALAVHEQTGGDLVSVLDRLSHTLRERAQFVGRLNAATAASKGTAILMVGLPIFVILPFLLLRNPNYFSDLMSSRWGFFATMTAIVLQAIGSFLVLAILNRSQKA